MEEQQIKEEMHARTKSDSFSYGSNSKGGSGIFKCYMDFDKPIEEIQKDLEKRLKVLKFLQVLGFCKPNE